MLRKILAVSGLLGLCVTPVLGNSFPSAPVYPSFNSPHRDAQLKKIRPPRASDTQVEDINSSGVIIGYYVDKDEYGFVRSAKGAYSGAITGSYFGGSNSAHGFVRAVDGTITSFDPAGSISTNPLGINAQGSVVGNYSDSKRNLHGFLRNAKGKITTIDFAGAKKGTALTCINDKGEIAGYYIDSKGAYHGFTRGTGGTFTSFDAPGAGKKKSQGTYAASINNAGVIAGDFSDAANKTDSGYVRAADGAITVFAPEGSVGTYPLDINTAGAITGFYLANESTIYGFVRATDGTITAIYSLQAGGLGTRPLAINSSGLIVGSYYDEKNNAHGFERTP
jgi:hypothetical protein